MAPKVQGTRNDSIHRVPPSFLSTKTLQHCKHTGLNQAYFTRSLIINTFFASLPGVNFIRKKARVCGSIASLLYAVCLYRAYGRWTLSLHIYIMNSWYRNTYSLGLSDSIDRPIHRDSLLTINRRYFYAALL